MTKYSTNNFYVINLHKKASAKSEVVTQMIYGESFSILKKKISGSKLKLKKTIIKVIFNVKIIQNI